MTLGALLVHQNTRVTISIATLLFVIGSTATLTFSLSKIKTEMDVSINTLQQDDIRIEQKFDIEVSVLKETDRSIIEEQQTNRALLTEANAKLAGFGKDIEWIKATQLRILEKLE